MLGALVERLRASSVEVHGSAPGGGSGVRITSGGLIVTNAHVARSRGLRVRLASGQDLDAELVARDARRDLALLRIPADGLPFAKLGDSAALRPGQVVAAIGNPFGITGAVTMGVIHAVDGGRWVQADIRLAPGNSGGMLVDAQGEVIGINTMIWGGLAMAVPSNAVRAFVRTSMRSQAAA